MDKQTKEQIEGTVNVQGDVTPITRTPVPQINSTTWENQSVSQLHTELEKIRQRYYLAQSLGLPLSALQQIQRGIFQLEALIRSKSPPATSDGDTFY